MLLVGKRYAFALQKGTFWSAKHRFFSSKKPEIDARNGHFGEEFTFLNRKFSLSARFFEPKKRSPKAPSMGAGDSSKIYSWPIPTCGVAVLWGAWRVLVWRRCSSRRARPFVFRAGKPPRKTSFRSSVAADRPERAMFAANR